MKKLIQTIVTNVIFTALIFTAKAQTYCSVSPSPDCTGGLYISNVTLGSINNNSSCGGYTNTGLYTNLVTGNTYNLSVTLQNVANNLLSAEIRVFIDYSRDSDFCDADELVHTEWDQLPTGVPVSFSFMVPSTATPGITRMRIIADSLGGGAPSHSFDACGGNNVSCNAGVSSAPFTGHGEVEDYYINLRSPIVPNCALVVYPQMSASSIPTDTILHWTDGGGNGGTNGYKLYFGTDNPPTNRINGTNVGNVTSYSLTSLSLQPNTQYYWRVVAYNTIGDATACSNWNFTTAALTGIKHFVTPSFNVSVSPNPFDEHFNLKFLSASGEDVKIELTNVTGSIVYSEMIKPQRGTNTEIAIPAASYAGGVYLCRIISGIEIETLKVIKIQK